MLEMTKKVLLRVSFDKTLFHKELKKASKWLSKDDYNQLKVWCMASFTMYADVVSDVFQS
jgi:coproporphyrinogen III oxidase